MYIIEVVVGVVLLVNVFLFIIYVRWYFFVFVLYFFLFNVRVVLGIFVVLGIDWFLFVNVFN